MKLSVTVLKITVLVAAMATLTSCVSKKKYDQEVTRAAAEKAGLESQISSANAKNDSLSAAFSELEKNLNMSKQEIVDLSKTIAENKKEISELETAINEVFETYNPSDINVEEREGKLYIALSNAILFDAGRDKLTKESEELIGKMAEVFNKNGKLSVMVEGHTDSDPVKIHRNKFKDNWSLSAARALAVVRSLEEAGVSTKRLTATGKGDTMPIAPNDTKENKEKNRRTEFVIVPDVEGLWDFKKSMDGGNN
ncbi:MAG: OmpA family protein [Bacteroidia bacterium]|nr:OmpA family protein [Bacteroidia bacterium]